MVLCFRGCRTLREGTQEHGLPNRKRKPGKILEKVPTYAVPDVLFDSFSYLRLHGADLTVFLHCCRLANRKRDDDGQFVFEVRSAEAATHSAISNRATTTTRIGRSKAGGTDAALNCWV